MIETQVTIRRGASQTSPTGGTLLASNVVVQIDTLNAMLAAEMGFDPYDNFNGYIIYLPPSTSLLRGDAWLDQRNTDPLTGNAVFYQVVSRPQAFPDGHVECILRIYEGAA